MIGKKLGYYQITAKPGRLGMGVACKACDTHLDRYVAIELPPMSPDGSIIRSASCHHLAQRVEAET